MKIGILGSTCNPPHHDHIAIGEHARRELGLDRVIFVPAKAPPHKDPPKVPAEVRLAMARVAVQGIDSWEVSPIEFEREGKSYTKDTIQALQKRYPHDELFYIIGADSIVSMPWKWNGGWGLLDLCTFVVAPRLGFPLETLPSDILKKVIVLQKEPSALSSTHIREALKNGTDVRAAIHPEVLQFIQKNNLYV